MKCGPGFAAKSMDAELSTNEPQSEGSQVRGEFYFCIRGTNHLPLDIF